MTWFFLNHSWLSDISLSVQPIPQGLMTSHEMDGKSLSRGDSVWSGLAIWKAGRLCDLGSYELEYLNTERVNGDKWWPFCYAESKLLCLTVTPTLSASRCLLVHGCLFGTLCTSSLSVKTSDSTFCLTALQIQNVNWQVPMNRRAHHTDKFSSQDSIVRRGQPWEIILVCNRSLESGEDLNFIVSTGTHHAPSTNACWVTSEVSLDFGLCLD